VILPEFDVNAAALAPDCDAIVPEPSLASNVTVLSPTDHLAYNVNGPLTVTS
jgi:hypothetical protein